MGRGPYTRIGMENGKHSSGPGMDSSTLGIRERYVDLDLWSNPLEEVTWKVGLSNGGT